MSPGYQGTLSSDPNEHSKKQERPLLKRTFFPVKTVVIRKKMKKFVHVLKARFMVTLSLILHELKSWLKMQLLHFLDS